MKKKVQKSKSKTKAKPARNAKPKSKPKINAVKVKKEKPIGVITHFYGDLSVAIVKFKKPVKTGIKLHFKGATTDFEETIKSMQFDHKPVQTAKKGQQVGIKVGKKVREGDEVFASE